MKNFFLLIFPSKQVKMHEHNKECCFKKWPCVNESVKDGLLFHFGNFCCFSPLNAIFALEKSLVRKMNWKILLDLSN